MKHDITLSGYLIDINGVRQQLPVVLNPSNTVIESTIKTASSSNKGVVVLRCRPAPEIGPEKLELYADAGNLLLMLGTNEADGDYSVRTPTIEGMQNNLMIILGEKYPAKAITHDIDFVCIAFNEFARNGDVSRNLLS